jgi:hypothetical protein
LLVKAESRRWRLLRKRAKKSAAELGMTTLGFNGMGQVRQSLASHKGSSGLVRTTTGAIELLTRSGRSSTGLPTKGSF